MSSFLKVLLLACCLIPVSPSWAFWGLLGKVGSSAGKVGSAAGKVGATTGSAVKGAAVGVAGVELADTANLAAKAGKSVTGATAVAPELMTAEQIAKASGLERVMTADEISKASGLGKAVPDEVARMMTFPERKMSEASDAGVRSWLSAKPESLSLHDAGDIMRDYARLLGGKPALGRPEPLATRAAVAQRAARADGSSSAKANKPATEIPWLAIELLARAAHVGDKAAKDEMQRICRETGLQKNPPPACTKKV